MSELASFIHLGFRHITDLEAMDHILFLVALAAIYRGSDWRNCLWVISAFTAGHSITLALAVTGALRLPMRFIEFLIPVTILLTGLENLIVRNRAHAPLGGRYRPIFAGIFGLVHGAGFANYLRSLFTGSIALPLFGFNVGIELGQIAVLALAAVALAGLDGIIGAARLPESMPSAYRLRVVAVSLVVVAAATEMAAARSPW
jgi:hypothetical protein